jgi:copper chaperone CopZ
MKTEDIIVANIKCNGCVATIKKELLKIEGVKSVKVNEDKDTVTVTHEDVDRDTLVQKLHAFGYPEATEKNGLLLQLKSYTSCMLGRIHNIRTV